ncbi:MAG: hypothetical protein EOP47_25260 [Sphingobacteriaceae bacterium]|nr:MAG: hypothetical protein EOP47_25260 [Sphingobacteriaceae bacterium]
MTSSSGNNNDTQSNNDIQSRTNPNADANQAPAKQDYTADAVFDKDKLSSQQVEGLTDTDELSRQLDKNPENALNEQGLERKNATELNDGSAGNQSIRNAVENLNEDELEHNLVDQDKSAT